MKERLQLNLRIDGRSDLLDAIKKAADESGLSTNAWVIAQLELATGVRPQKPALVSAIAPASPALEQRLATLEERLAALEAERLGERAA